MIAIKKRVEMAAQSILENEAITADLDDDAASALVKWGVTLAQEIAMTTVEMEEGVAEDAMYRPMRALRKMLRTTTQWTADPQSGKLDRILQQAEIVFGPVFTTPDDNTKTAFIEALPDDTLSRVNALTAFLSARRTGDNPESGPPPTIGI